MNSTEEILNLKCECGHINALHIHKDEMGFPYVAKCKECNCPAMKSNT